jgi:hypothetical protein
MPDTPVAAWLAEEVISRSSGSREATHLDFARVVGPLPLLSSTFGIRVACSSSPDARRNLGTSLA